MLLCTTENDITYLIDILRYLIDNPMIYLINNSIVHPNDNYIYIYI